MTATSEYYNVVLNPGDVPILGINDTVERPEPLPEPEPEPRTVIHFDIRTIETVSYTHLTLPTSDLV